MCERAKKKRRMIKFSCAQHHHDRHVMIRNKVWWKDVTFCDMLQRKFGTYTLSGCSGIIQLSSETLNGFSIRISICMNRMNGVWPLSSSHRVFDYYFSKIPWNYQYTLCCYARAGLNQMLKISITLRLYSKIQSIESVCAFHFEMNWAAFASFFVSLSFWLFRSNE